MKNMQKSLFFSFLILSSIALAKESSNEDLQKFYDNMKMNVTPLAKAVGHNDIEAVKQLIASGADVNEIADNPYMTCWKSPVIFHAICNHNLAMVELLINSGSDMEIICQDIYGSDYTMLTFFEAIVQAIGDSAATYIDGHQNYILENINIIKALKKPADPCFDTFGTYQAYYRMHDNSQKSSMIAAALAILNDATLAFNEGLVGGNDIRSLSPIIHTCDWRPEWNIDRINYIKKNIMADLDKIRVALSE